MRNFTGFINLKIVGAFALLFNLLANAQALPTLTWDDLDEFFIYQAHIDRTLDAHLVETGPENRTQSADLWLSIETPSDELFFLTPSEQTPFSLEPQPAKTAVTSAETNHRLQLPLDQFPQQLAGEYTLSAFYVDEGKNPMIDGLEVYQSEPAIQAIVIHDATKPIPDTPIIDPQYREILIAYLQDWQNTQAVTINDEGKITAVGDEKTLYAQLAHEIKSGTPPADGALIFTPIEDANGDGLDDYLITYPDGKQQRLYYFGYVDETGTPEPFHFTDVLYAVGDTDYISNTITIKGIEKPSILTVDGGIQTSIIKNGIDTGSTTVTVISGDTIAIKSHSASLTESESDPQTRSRQTRQSQKATQTITITIGEFVIKWLIETIPLVPLQDEQGAKTGETASFDINESGAVAYQIPMTIAPGTGGIQPNLSLTYSNHGNNGPLGLGFSLAGLSVITRCKMTLDQDGFIDGVDFDDNDQFCLDGERLVAINGDYGADGTEYRTEHTNFSKIKSFGMAGVGPAKFTVWTKAGLIMEYGHSEDSRIEAQGKTSVLFWAVNKVKDTKDNYFTVSYYEDNAIGEYYPTRIDYTGNDKVGLKPYNSIQFSYEDRSDMTPKYIGGSLVKMTHRLVSVKAYEKIVLFREYQLAYEESPRTHRSRLTSITECGSDGVCFDPPTRFEWSSESYNYGGIKGPKTFVGDTIEKASLDVSRIKFGDFNGDGKTDIYRVIGWGESKKDRIELSHGDGEYTRIDGIKSPVSGESIKKAMLSIARIKFGDFNGDGKTDIYQVKGSGSPQLDQIYLSQGNGTYEEIDGISSYVSDESVKKANLSLSRLQFGDFNGDGKTDIYQIKGIGESKLDLIHLSHGDGTYEKINGIQSYVSDESVKKTRLSLSRFKFGDFNGDGKTDIYRVKGEGESQIDDVWLSQGDGEYQRINGAKTFVSEESVEKSLLSVAQIQLGDFNGDGKTDIYRFRLGGGSKKDRIFLSHGDGQYTMIDGIKSYIGDATVGTSLLDISRIRLADFNGDGKTDAYRIRGWNNSQEDSLFLSLGNGKYSKKINTIKGHLIGGNISSATFDVSRHQHGDFNGDGYTDIYIINGWGNNGGGDRVQLNLRKKQKSQSELPLQQKESFIKTITHTNKAKIQIEYQPITNDDVYTKDNGAVYPEQDFQGPIYVVTSYKTSNGISDNYNQISYRYGGAKTHLQGRGFRGFGWVEKTEQQRQVKENGEPVEKADEQAEKTEIITTTYYEQDHRYGNNVLKVEQRLADNTLISEVNNTLDFTEEKNVYFTFVKNREEKSYDLDGSFIALITTEQQYDEYGNLTAATVTHDDGYTETITNTYTNDPDNWFLGRLTKTIVSKNERGQSSQTRTSAFEYDSASGLLTKEIIEPDQATLRLEKAYQHDVYGNIIQSTLSGADIEPRTHVTRYDSTGRFIIESENALGHKETKTYRLGQLIALTGPNGLTTRWEYDGFGRKISEIRADGTETKIARNLCTKEDKNCPDGTFYKNAVDTQCTDKECAGIAVYYVHTGISGAAPTLVYYDKLDREIYRGTNGFDGRTLYVATEYNERGLVKRVSEPFFAGESPLWTENEYDVLRRIVKQTAPDGSVTETAYQGLTTIITNPLGQKNTRTVNSRKQLIESKDNLDSRISYIYDGFGNLLELRDPAGNVTQMEYDLRGNKITMKDPDTGTTTYQHNVLGELVSQTDANGQTVQMRYDTLGRLIWRQEPEGITEWTYDTQPKGIGKLAQLDGPNDYQEVYTYGNFGRLIETMTNIGDEHYPVSQTYDQYGRLDTLTYPTSTGFAIRNSYNDNGYLTEVRRARDDYLYWQADKLNARGQIEQQTLGNGLVTQKVYDSQIGRLQQIQTPGVQNLGFTFDEIGNLTQRSKDQLVENFQYDGLNRLIKTSVASGYNTTINYDNLGNITYKSDVGNYTYGSSRPHAVTAVNGLVDNQYRYDANGNRISSATGTVAYTSFNKPHTITEGQTELQFQYGPNHARYQQKVIKNGVTTSTKIYIGGVYEQEITDTFTKDIHYIFANGESIAIDVEQTDTDDKSTRYTQYLHKDHLGSITAITDEQGVLVENLSFDAWGQRRADNWNTFTEAELLALLDKDLPIDRGFTGHEHLDEVQLIHTNGRLYDPVIGRFLSADPFVQAPTNTQSLNRYSYVLNNPLSLIDPSGYFSLKEFFKDAIKTIATTVVGVAIGMISAGIAAWAASVIASQASGGLATLLSKVTDAIVSKVLSSVLSSISDTLFNGGSFKDNLKVGLISGLINGLSAGAKTIVNHGTSLLKETIPNLVADGIKIAANSTISGISTEAKGGKFRHGFFAGLQAEAEAISKKIKNPIGRIAASAVLGGTAAKIGGGKFANGAITAAFYKTANVTYEGLVGEQPDIFGPAEADPNKCTTCPPTPKTNHFGIQGFDVFGNHKGGWLREGKGFSRFMSTRIPFMNATAGIHDVMQTQWFKSGPARYLLNVPSMPIAFVWAVAAYKGK